MADSFSESLERLKISVGAGNLVGSVEVDQVYAKAQHEREDFVHPQGGDAKYLEGPLQEKYVEYVQRLANAAINPEGSRLGSAMQEIMEDLSDEVHQRAPRKVGDLRDSTHVLVTDNGVPIYERMPRKRRLTQKETEAKPRDNVRRRHS